MKQRIHVEYDNLEWTASQMEIMSDELESTVRQLWQAVSLLEGDKPKRVKMLLSELRARMKDGEKLYQRWDKAGRISRITSRKFAAEDQRLAKGKIGSLKTMPYSLKHVHEALLKSTGTTSSHLGTVTADSQSSSRSTQSSSNFWVAATAETYIPCVLRFEDATTTHVAVQSSTLQQIAAALTTASVVVSQTPQWLVKAFDEEMSTVSK